MDDWHHKRDARSDLQAVRNARRLLDVAEDASEREVRRAWRKACLRTHPDHRPGDPDAIRKFRLVNCAYRLLAEGIPCPELAVEYPETQRPAQRATYDPANPWAFYLWWRNTFF